MALDIEPGESRRRLLAYTNERLDALRPQLEAVGIEERKADVIRGRIAELKTIVSAITNEATNE